MTDGDEEVLSLCNKNILLNNKCLNASTELLRWDDQSKAKHIIDVRGGTGFDVIIGADCLYGRDPNIAEHLFASASIVLRNIDNLTSDVERLNSFSEPSLILGYERRVGGGDIASVFETAAKHGFDWSLGDDAILDMFGNVISELTMFWEQAVFVFTKRRNICRESSIVI